MWSFKMVELTKEMKEELKGICINSQALGAFSGMIFNAVREIENKGAKTDEELVKMLIQQALSIRVLARGMNNEE